MFTTRSTQLAAVAAPALALLLAGATALPAQEEEQPQAMEEPATAPSMPMHHDMMAMHQRMHARMEAMDTQLADLVATMDAATGDAKVDAIAAVVTELVAQRRAMHQMMTEMQPMMMGHMMEGMHHSMADCPMMKTGDCPMMKKDSPENGEGAETDEHSEHYPEG